MLGHIVNTELSSGNDAPEILFWLVYSAKQEAVYEPYLKIKLYGNVDD